MNTDLIIKKLKDYSKCVTDKQLYDFLGIKSSTFGNWRARKTVDFDLIMRKFPEVDYNWLFKDEGEVTQKVEKSLESELLAFYKREYERKCAELDAANARCDRLIDKLGCNVQQSNKSGDNNFNNQ